MARPRKKRAPDLRVHFRLADPPPELQLTDLQRVALTIEIEGFEPRSEVSATEHWPCRFTAGQVSKFLKARRGLTVTPQMVNKWRKQEEYRQGFFRLLDQQYWPELKQEISDELNEMESLSSNPKRQREWARYLKKEKLKSSPSRLALRRKRKQKP